MSDEPETTLANDLVVTKYKTAGEMVNRVLAKLIALCVDGARIVDLCKTGDQLLEEESGKEFKKDKEMRKGIAFPTCISINNCVCHFSPLTSDKEHYLADGDLVKIDLGLHIDGYIAVAAHSLVVGASNEKKVTGRKADVMLAAYYASQVALRLVQPGKENLEVTKMIQDVSEIYNCKPISGMLSHQLKQFRIDGEKSIIQNPTDLQRKEHEKCSFALQEVYAIDVLVSTGEGKGRESEVKTTVFKKTDLIYQLKLRASRVLLSEVEKRFGTMPFTLRAFADENKARLGVSECVNHKLLDPFNVIYEKDGEFVAQFKYTVLLMPSGSHVITGVPFDKSVYESEFKIENNDIKTLVEKSLIVKKKKKPSQASAQAQAQAATPAASVESTA